MEYAEMRERLIKVLSKRDGMTLKEILEKLNKTNQENLFQNEETKSDIEKLVKTVLRTESRSPQSSIMQSPKKKRGANLYKIRSTRGTRPLRLTTKPETDTTDTNYIGKSGEFAVLSELVARGYNANIMTIDEGIDIVASKDNIFYYIQVKTTYIANGMVAVHIPLQNYTRVERNNAIYVIAIRESIGIFRYFIFHQNDIENLKIGRYIEQSEANINIKIAYDDVTNEPFLYNGREKTSAKAYQAEIKGFQL